MKHLNTFKTFEAVILPDRHNPTSTTGNTYNDLKKYCEENDIDFVSYDEFYETLNDREKSEAPPRNAPFFALFNPHTLKPMFVANIQQAINAPMFGLEFFIDILTHENIHKEQYNRMNNKIEYALPNPRDSRAYLSDQREVMAFAYTLAKDLYNEHQNFSDAIKAFKENKYEMQRQMWSNISINVDEKTLKKYKKYIYMYLDKLYNENNLNENLNNDDLKLLISDLILTYCEIIDTPYSRQDGQVEISSDSVEEASEEIIKMLKEKGYIKNGEL